MSNFKLLHFDSFPSGVFFSGLKMQLIFHKYKIDNAGQMPLLKNQPETLRMRIGHPEKSQDLWKVKKRAKMS